MRKLILFIGCVLIAALTLGDSTEIPVGKLTGVVQSYFDDYEATSHKIRDERSKAAFVARFPEPKK